MLDRNPENYFAEVEQATFSTRLVQTIVGAMKPVKTDEIKLRQIGHFYKADPEYGICVAEGLGLSIPE